jgi:fatty acid desaturase
MTAVFACESFLIPLALLVRFVILTPVGFFSPAFQRWLVVHFSSLTMNVKYRRESNPKLIRRVQTHSAVVFAMWASILAAAIGGKLPWRLCLTLLAVDSLISFVNTLRTLGAHEYENDGRQLSRLGQLADSIDTPGGFWTEFWAPVGLRYHALHHYFPGIPYHNLPEAYGRIMRCVAVAADYGCVLSPGLPYSLQELVRKGMRSPRLPDGPCSGTDVLDPALPLAADAAPVADRGMESRP